MSPIALVILILALCSNVVARKHELRMVIPPCPQGSRPLLRPDGQPRKCLPHQNSLCVNALPDNPDADTVCCYNNQVDYFCCLDTTAEQCPDYHQVTVVIHNSFPQNPFSLKSYFFREGIEDDIIKSAFDNSVDNGFGRLVKRQADN